MTFFLAGLEATGPQPSTDSFNSLGLSTGTPGLPKRFGSPRWLLSPGACRPPAIPNFAVGSGSMVVSKEPAYPKWP